MKRTRFILFAATIAFALFSCKSADKSTVTNIKTKIDIPDERQQPLSYFNVYRGNTHTHTIFTWTHGEHRKELIKDLSKPTPFHPDFIAPPGTDWKDDKTINLNPEYYPKLQGLPANHLALAKANGYDFFAITDHTQEPSFQPVSPDNWAWQATLKAVEKYDNDPEFVAISGFEYSRNTNTDGGQGHINVLNAAEYVNADHGQRGPAAPWPEANWSIPKFYGWVKAGPKNHGPGDVVVGFNHPSLNQYGDFGNIDEEIIKRICTFELHTNYNAIRWNAYIRALNKGWKLSPIGVLDHHGYTAILNPAKFPPTLVLAPELTKKAVMTALKERRTYASWIKGTELRYSVNGFIMGSTLDSPDKFNFNIQVKTRPSNPEDRVRKIQIVRNDPEKENDVIIAAEALFEGKDEVNWTPVIEDATARYFLLRVFHEKDIKEDKTYKPHGSTVSAPVWTGR